MRVIFLIFAMLTSANAAPNVRGWDRLVQNLISSGVDEADVIKTFSDPRMQRYELVAFALKPREPARIYTWFFKAKNIALAKKELENYKSWFDSAEKRFLVPKETIAAILLIETQFGRITGRSVVINRLARLANIGQADNLEFNYRRHKQNDKSTTKFDTQDRARYLEELFMPEVAALLSIAKDRKLDVFGILGSRAGAIGIPQFLPGSMLRFGIDANQNGQVSLFEMPDAIHSTANFLAKHGWTPKNPTKQREAVYSYNRSDAYVDAVLNVAKKL